MLNDDFLKAFGTSGQGVEFDYANPIPQFDTPSEPEPVGLQV